MLSASALPITGTACCNRKMLQGEELAAALAEAITLKKAVRGFENLGPSRLARDFEIAQSSASEWLKYGRVAKKHIGKLLEYFADVVGPEHWGLPFGKREFNAMLVYRQLPEQMQLDLLVRMEAAVAASKAAQEGIGKALEQPVLAGKPRKHAG